MCASSAASHVAVMVAEVLAALDPAPGQVFADCTVGAGGHAGPILARISPNGLLIGMDVDGRALDEARARLSGFGGCVRLLQGNFRDLKDRLQECGVTELDGILADLGVSSGHLNDPARGFSFLRDGPLDMRMGSAGQSAADLVAEADEESLADIIWRYGEERASRRIARAIVRARRQAPIVTTGKLCEVVMGAFGLRVGAGHRGRRHPATRTFQALRIAVNDELGSLDSLLAVAPGLLRAGGRMAILSYHSLEDRKVKARLKELASDGRFEWEGPLRPTEREAEENPRSRSARLRAVRRLQ